MFCSTCTPGWVAGGRTSVPARGDTRGDSAQQPLSHVSAFALLRSDVCWACASACTRGAHAEPVRSIGFIKLLKVFLSDQRVCAA